MGNGDGKTDTHKKRRRSAEKTTREKGGAWEEQGREPSITTGAAASMIAMTAMGIRFDGRCGGSAVVYSSFCVARDADANSHPLLKRDRPRDGGAASLQFHQHPLLPLPPNATVDGNYARDWAVCAFHLFLHAGTQARGILYILVGQRKCLIVSSEDFSFPSALHFASFAAETVLLDPESYCARAADMKQDAKEGGGFVSVALVGSCGLLPGGNWWCEVDRLARSGRRLS